VADDVFSWIVLIVDGIGGREKNFTWTGSIRKKLTARSSGHAFVTLAA
jgi:hypothetical protein